jgi:hypothetical protein
MSQSVEKVELKDDPDNVVQYDHESDEVILSENEAGESALVNAPWQYKLIALVTALLFPRT